MKCRLALFTLLLMCIVITFSCASKQTPKKPDAVSPALQRLELAGCDNAIRLTPKIISGSQPHGDAAFKALASQGVKTIISVDGAKPELELADKYGMRYVHLPFGYDGVPEHRALEVTRAVRDLPGPIYIHCHHGVHRGPAAAAIACVAVEGWSNEEAIAFMKEAGTSSKYAGLYGSVSVMRHPSQAEVDAADNSFPEIAQLPGFVTAMADIDRRWDHFKQIRAADWAVPPDHPDIDPPHEALLLHELFVELNRTQEVQDKPQDFRNWMHDAQQATDQLEQALRTDASASAEMAFTQVGTTCKSCHAKYRNNSH